MAKPKFVASYYRQRHVMISSIHCESKMGKKDLQAKES